MLEGYQAVLLDGSIWVFKGLRMPSKDLARLLPRRSAAYKCSSLSCSYRVAREVYPWTLRFDPCIGGVAPLVEEWEIRSMLDPYSPPETADPDALRLESLLEDYSGVEVGVTGSSMLGRGNDLDLVVHGLEESRRVYAALAELRRSGILKPLEGEALKSEYVRNIEDTPLEPWEYAAMAGERLLLGVYEGRPYSIRLVPRRRPVYGCSWVVKIGWIRVRGRVFSREPFLTPTYYSFTPRATAGDYPVDGIETHRLRFMEFPSGTVVEAYGVLEMRPGPRYVLIPDYPGGYLRIL